MNEESPVGIRRGLWFGGLLCCQARKRRTGPVGVGFFVVRLNSASTGKDYGPIPELASRSDQSVFDQTLASSDEHFLESTRRPAEFSARSLVRELIPHSQVLQNQTRRFVVESNDTDHP